jgi:tRNA pseudouridine55 synthase
MVELFGFINLNKPAGFTSHDCVAKLRRLLKTKKIGHGGTLDPAATGVLPIAIGKATRLLQFLPENKAYRARIRLGITTTTDDLAGEILATRSVGNIDRELIISKLANFVGTIEQIPPIYSAIKKDGKKLYELARKGIEVEVTPRRVTIDRIDLIEIIREDFTELELDIDCSAGTYIRSIARDLGNLLGVGGTLASLVRTKSCGMELDRSLTFEEIEAKLRDSSLVIIPPAQTLKDLKSIVLTAEDARLWCQGQKINIEHLNWLERDFPSYIATYHQDNHFLGISLLIQEASQIQLKPKIVCYEPMTNNQ